MLRRALSLTLLLALSLATGCSGDDGRAASSERKHSRAAVQAQAPPPSTSAALVRVPDGAAAQRRLGYVDIAALATTRTPLSRREVADAALGRGARHLAALPRDAVRSAVQVGTDVTILRGPGAVSAAGVRSPPDGVVLGARDANVRKLALGRPATSAITPLAQSAVQSCLGQTIAQTSFGPAVMGRDSALGAGLAQSGDRPAGIQLRICGAPRLLRDLHAMERALKRSFADASGGAGREPVIGEREIGEREIVAATIAADAIPAPRLRALLAGGELHALAWR